MTAGKTLCLSSGLNYQNVGGWETLNIFLLTGISKIKIFFKKKKNNVVFNSNIYDEFASKILNYNIKKYII